MTETESSTKTSGDNLQNAQLEELPSKSATARSRNVQEETGINGLKETQDSAKYDEGLISCDVKETGDSVGLDYIKTQQRGKKEQFESHPTLEQPHITSHVKDDFTVPSPMTVEGVLLKEGLPSCEQKLASQNENYSKFNFVLVSILVSPIFLACSIVSETLHIGFCKTWVISYKISVGNQVVHVCVFEW